MIDFIILLASLSAIWFAFEIWLLLRDRKQGKGKTRNDRGSVYFNFLAILIGIGAAAVLSGDPRFYFPGGRRISIFVVGFGIMLLGLALRAWAVTILGEAFRTTVETHENQQVIRTGPYKLLRHPSYSGLLLICTGYGIAVQSWLSLATVIVLPLAALLYRIHVEEAFLLSAMGAEYQDYKRHTKKLIPWIW